MYKASVAGFQQWDTFPKERRGSSPPTVNGLMETYGSIATPLTDFRQFTIIVINNTCQRRVFHEGLLSITRVTSHILFKNKLSICIKLT